MTHPNILLTPVLNGTPQSTRTTNKHTGSVNELTRVWDGGASKFT